MRNLKRVLSLTLAAVMVLGLMITGAGAVNLDDFSDRDEIVNDEAVLVLTTLNVINGKSDGSYDPKGTITRGEMTKMICVILNGGTDPILAETVNNTYTDTVGHWAAPYIEYCTALGIVAGRGDKKFDPDGNVSVAEAAKMLLVAIGYNAGVEGYVGANWQINTDVRANVVDLYDGMEDMNTSTILTRDNAALMCYNALDVHMVTYDYIITGNSNNAITTKPQLNDSEDNDTLLYAKFGAVKVTGVVIGNEFSDMENKKTDTDRAPSGTVIGAALDEGKTKIVVTNYEDGQDLYRNQSYTFNISTGEEVLGKAVNMYIKPAKDSNNTNRATVIGSAILSEDNAIVTDCSGDSLQDVLDDHNLTLEDRAGEFTVQYAYNYANVTSTDRDGKIGVQRTLVDIDGDNKVEYVLYREMELGKVTLYTEANDGQIVVAVNGGNYVTKDKADIAGFENVAQGDYVLTAFFGGVQHVQQAETVTGTINAYKQSDSQTLTGESYRTTDFTIDSENYKVSRVKSYDGDITAAIHEVDKSILSSEATFYLDENGYVVAYGEVDENAYKYVLVWGAEANSNILSDRVKVTREDGTEATYNVSTTSDIDIVDAEHPTARDGKVGINENNMAGRVFGYTMTSSGEIKLYLPKKGTVNSNAAPDFTKGLTLIKLTNATPDTLVTPSGETPAAPYYSNNATTFFYVDATYNANGSIASIDDVTVYNGRNNAPSVDGAKSKNGATLVAGATLALNTKGDVGGAAFFNVDVTESAEDHMFVYKANFVSEDYVTVDAFMSGDVTATKDVRASLYDDGEIVNNPDVDANIYLYKIDSDGNYELSLPNDKAYYFEGYVSRVNKNNNTFVLACDTAKSGDAQAIEEFKIDSKSVVIDYDSDDDNPVAVSAGTVNQGDYLQIIVNNTDDHIVLMAVIMSRDPNYTGNPTTGVDMTWDGRQPAGTETIYDMDDPATCEQKIREAFAANEDVFVVGNYTLNANLIIPEGRRLYVGGDLNNTGFTLTNNGSLFVDGNLTTAESGSSYSANASATKNSVLEVHGNWDISAVTGGVTTNGTVRIGGAICGNVTNHAVGAGKNLTVAADSKLYAGKINLGITDATAGTTGGTLTVDGHAEVNGYTPANSTTPVDGDVIADGVTVTSTETLIIKNLLNCTTLTVGTTTKAGRVDLNKVDNGCTVEVKGSSTVKVTDMQSAKLDLTDAKSASLDVRTTGSVGLTGTVKENITISFNVTIDSSFTIGAGVTLTLNSRVTDPAHIGTAGEGAQIKFGSNASISGEPGSFVGTNGVPLGSEYLAGSTFAVTNEGEFTFVTSTNPGTYTYATGTETGAVTNSKNLY